MTNYDDDESGPDRATGRTPPSEALEAESKTRGQPDDVTSLMERIRAVVLHEQPVDAESVASLNLKRIRRALGVSQQQIAAKLAKSVGPVRLAQTQIAKIERGERPWRLNEVVAIASVLGVSIEDLLSHKGVEDDLDVRLMAARLDFRRSIEVAEECKRASVSADHALRRSAYGFALRAAELEKRDDEVWAALALCCRDVGPSGANEDVRSLEQRVEDEWERLVSRARARHARDAARKTQED